MKPEILPASAVVPPVADPRILKEQFISLADRWRSETQHLSSLTRIVMHRDYQRIMGMGPVAIPFILEELSRRTDFWFWALTSLSGEDPVTDEERGDVEKMAASWLRWGAQKGLINYGDGREGIPGAVGH